MGDYNFRPGKIGYAATPVVRYTINRVALAAPISAIIKRPEFEGCRWQQMGDLCSLLRGQDGSTLEGAIYEHEADRFFTIASNPKMLSC